MATDTDTSDSKDWTTIKIPRETRDRARDDPRTYEQIFLTGLGVRHVEGDVEELADELVDRLDYGRLAAALEERVRQ